VTRTKRIIVLAALALVAPQASIAAEAPAAGASAGAGADATPKPKAKPEPKVIVTTLSDEVKTSRWAYPTDRASIRSAPSTTARTVARLRVITEDGLPDTYLLLSRRQEGTQDWVQVRIPGRPNGRTGWVQRDALGDFMTIHTSLLVERARHRVTVRKFGKVVATFPIAIGKASTPTPAGRFWIREKFVVNNAPAYGPRALGTSAYAPHLTDWPNGGVVGFHGTNEPGLIPGSPSHGCIRLRNADILRMYQLVPLGTPLRIV
jgi:hypothetical protein